MCRKDHREEAKQYDKHTTGTFGISSKNDSTQLVGHVSMELWCIVCCFLRAHHNNVMVVKVAGSRKLENGLVVPGSFTAFTQSVEMGRIFKGELVLYVYKRFASTWTYLMKRLVNYLHYITCSLTVILVREFFKEDRHISCYDSIDYIMR